MDPAARFLRTAAAMGFAVVAGACAAAGPRPATPAAEGENALRVRGLTAREDPTVYGARLLPASLQVGRFWGGEPAGSSRVVVGGVRLLVAPDGTLSAADDRFAASPASIIALPERLGGGFLFAVNRAQGPTQGTLWRADRWLGPATPIYASSTPIGPVLVGLDRVYLRYAQGRLAAIDPRSGAPLNLGPLPVSPRFGRLTALDAWRALVVADGQGLLMTADAGSTWRPVALGADAVDVMPVDDAFVVAVDAATLPEGARRVPWWRVRRDGQVEPLDAPPGILGRSFDEAALASSGRHDAAARVFGARPLVAALEDGWPLSDGTALVARDGMLARVRLEDGALLESASGAFPLEPRGVPRDRDAAAGGPRRLRLRLRRAPGADADLRLGRTGRADARAPSVRRSARGRSQRRRHRGLGELQRGGRTAGGRARVVRDVAPGRVGRGPRVGAGRRPRAAGSALRRASGDPPSAPRRRARVGPPHDGRRRGRTGALPRGAPRRGPDRRARHLDERLRGAPSGGDRGVDRRRRLGRRRPDRARRRGPRRRVHPRRRPAGGLGTLGARLDRVAPRLRDDRRRHELVQGDLAAGADRRALRRARSGLRADRLRRGGLAEGGVGGDLPATPDPPPPHAFAAARPLRPWYLRCEALAPKPPPIAPAHAGTGEAYPPGRSEAGAPASSLPAILPPGTVAEFPAFAGRAEGMPPASIGVTVEAHQATARVYAWGPRGGDWDVAGRWQVHWSWPWGGWPDARGSSISPVPWPSVETVRRALGVGGNAAVGWALVPGDDADHALLVARRSGATPSTELLVLESDRPPVSVKSAFGDSFPEIDSAVRAGGRWYAMTTVQPWTVVWEIDGGWARELHRIPRAGLEGRGEGRGRLARRDDGRAVGVVVDGQPDVTMPPSGWVVPIDLPSGAAGDPEPLATPGVTQPALRVCTGDDAGWQLGVDYPGTIELEVGDGWNATLQSPIAEVRLRPDHACVDRLLGSMNPYGTAAPPALSVQGGVTPGDGRPRTDRLAGLPGTPRTVDVSVFSAGLRYPLRCWSRAP